MNLKLIIDYTNKFDYKNRMFNDIIIKDIFDDGVGCFVVRNHAYVRLRYNELINYGFVNALANDIMEQN